MKSWFIGFLLDAIWRYYRDQRFIYFSSEKSMVNSAMAAQVSFKSLFSYRVWMWILSIFWFLYFITLFRVVLGGLCKIHILFLVMFLFSVFFSLLNCNYVVWMTVWWKIKIIYRVIWNVRVFKLLWFKTIGKCVQCLCFSLGIGAQ